MIYFLLLSSGPSLLVSFIYHTKTKVQNWNGFSIIQTLQLIYTTCAPHQVLGLQSQRYYLRTYYLSFSHRAWWWIKHSILISKASVVVNTFHRGVRFQRCLTKLRMLLHKDDGGVVLRGKKPAKYNKVTTCGYGLKLVFYVCLKFLLRIMKNVTSNNNWRK